MWQSPHSVRKGGGQGPPRAAEGGRRPSARTSYVVGSRFDGLTGITRAPRAKDDSPRFQPWVRVENEPESPGDGSISSTRRVVPCPGHSESSNHASPAMKSLP